MKNKFKLVVSFMLSAVFALALTLGVANVNVAKADGEANAVTLDHDLSSYLEINDRGTNGDYGEAALFRLRTPSDPHATGWDASGVCLNEDGQKARYSAIKINGKSLADIRAEYLEIIKDGGDCPITWTDYPDNKPAYPHTMQPSIAAEVIENNAKAAEERHARYAPVFVSATNHGASYKSTIDIYIPNILFNEGGLLEGGIHTIEITTDFTYTDANDEVWGFSKNVKFGNVNSVNTYKLVGDKPQNVIETKVTHIDGSMGAGDKFVSFYLSESDYYNKKDDGTFDYHSPLNTKNLCAEAGVAPSYIHALNFFDHIELTYVQGDATHTVKFVDVIGATNDEFFMNVWGRSTALTNSFGTRWFNMAGLSDSITSIKVLAGCEFPSFYDPYNTVYRVAEDMVLARHTDGLFYAEDHVLSAENVAISDLFETGDADELYRVNITVDGLNYQHRDAYDVCYFGADNAAYRKSIFVNGKSVFEINTTVDDSAYVYATSPMTNAEILDPQGSGHQLFANPTLIFVEGNMISLLIHRDYVDDILANGEDLVIEVKDVSMVHFRSGEPVAKTVYTKPYDVTINGEAIKVAKGAKVERPADPTKESTVDTVYTFAGWFVGDVEYDFDAPVTSDLTIEARYSEAPRMYNLTMTVVGIDGIAPQAGQIPYGTEMPFVEMAADLVVEGYEHVVTVNGEEIDPTTYVHTVEGDVIIVVTYTAIEQGGGDVEDDSEEESTPVEDDSEEESVEEPTSEEESVEEPTSEEESVEAPATSEEESVEAPATSEEESVEAPVTSEPAEEPAAGGCMGAIGSTAGMLVAMLGAVAIIRKKRA